MLKEFAVEPIVLSTWEQFRYLTEKFGVSEGRLISRFPSKWKKMVYEALNGCSEIERKRIEVKLQNLDEKMMARPHEWSASESWLSNAAREHGRHPFDGILAQQNSSGHEAVLVASALDEDVAGWKVDRELVVPRDARAMAQAMRRLLQLSRRVVFVDPYFDPSKPRSRAAIEAYLTAIYSRDNGVPLDAVEFHTGSRLGIDFLCRECQARLPGNIPHGRSVRVVSWAEKQGGEGMHNRYVLTDRGGLSLRWGLDEGNAGQTDDLSLLSHNVYSVRWQQYCGDTPAFDLASSIEVMGQKQ